MDKKTEIEVSFQVPYAAAKVLDELQYQNFTLRYNINLDTRILSLAGDMEEKTS